MQVFNRLFLFAVVVLFALGACGGGGSSSDDEEVFLASPVNLQSPPPVDLGAIVDSPVTGINYLTNTGSGTTGLGGSFPYIPGGTITFSLGDNSLPTINMSRTVTPLDIFSTSVINDTSVVNFSRLLQSIDEDGDTSNGISIAPTAHVAATGLNIQFDSPTFDADVASLLANSGSVNSTLISAAVAQTHLQATLDDLPASGDYFEVYGAAIEDFDLDIDNQDLLGTSDGGLVFDVRGYSRFTIYVPPTSNKIYLDAIELLQSGGQTFTGFPDLIEPDEEISPRIANFNVTGKSIGSLCGRSVGCNGWYNGNLPVEDQPDGRPLESTPGKASYFSYQLRDPVNVEYIRLYIVNDLFAPLTCGFETDLDYSPYFTPTNNFSDFLSVVADCGGVLPTVANDVVGSYVLQSSEFLPETFTFNANGTGQYDSQGAGPFDTTWSISNNQVNVSISIVDPGTSQTVTLSYVFARTPVNTTVYFSFVDNLISAEGIRTGGPW